jgi:1A family penicillin-binding protein
MAGLPPAPRRGSARRFKGIHVGLPIAIVFFAAITVWTLHDISTARVLLAVPEPILLLEDGEGHRLTRKGPLRGVPVGRKELPQHLVDAVLAIEDQRFYEHHGLDHRGILRALLRNLRAGEIVEGGSTITQQLVKTLNLENQRSIKRKLREAVLAVVLENSLSKDEILVRYLNNVYFGSGVTGISAAARLYFSKPVSELSLKESVLLAGLVRAPSQLNPIRNIELARKRAALVLDKMVESGKVDRKTAEAAKSNPAVLKPSQLPSAGGSWFGDWAYEEALKKARAAGNDNLGTIQVRTTLSPKLQALAEEIVSNVLKSHGKASGASQAALVALRPDGAVLAMVGGRSYEESQFNRTVQARRQPGSTFKLFVYYAALLNGWLINDNIEDAPIRIGRWQPENSNGRYHGTVTLAEAFAHSYNAASVRLAQEVGIDQVVAAARSLGIDSPLSPTPSLALGASEVSLVDLAGAYASVLAGVAPVEPWGIAEMRKLPQLQPVAATGPARASTNLRPYQQSLIELLRGTVEYGTGRAAALDGFSAGKTGTSENYRDAWFVGFTDNLVAGVWVGNDDNKPMKKVTGGKLPALIWREFMSEASKILEPEEPADTVTVLSAYGVRHEKPQAASWDQILSSGRDLAENNDDYDSFDDEEATAGSISGSFAGERYEYGLSVPNKCDYDACSRAYRSFRQEDCSYQPYIGPRRICERRASAEITQRPGFDEEPYDEDVDRGANDDEEEYVDEDEYVDEEEYAGHIGDSACNYDACAATYSSFRALDCTYQPYQGRRRLCRK